MEAKIVQLDTKQIFPGNNDRTVFEPRALAELADSIRSHGLIQPITVRMMANDPMCVFGGNPLGGLAQFEIVAGERRFRACADILNWETIPAIVADLNDEEAAAVMLSENVARADIDPIDEARAYAVRMQMYGWTVADCAKRAGVSETRVHFRLKLLKLRSDLLGLVRTGNIGIGYAQVLADADLDPDRQMLAVRRLRDNPTPAIGWFRRIVGELVTQCHQQPLIETFPIFTGEPIPQRPPPLCEPPPPTTTRPPVAGVSMRERVTAQISFWEEAAAAWESLGKPFKRQECQAAAAALQFVFDIA